MHIVLIDIYVYASIVPVVHFNTITKGTVRCFVQFLYHSSAKDDRKFAHNCCPAAKYEGTCILVQTYNVD